MQDVCGRQWAVERVYLIFAKGKLGLDSLMKKIGRIVAKTIIYYRQGRDSRT
jgi:hypothetical protein